MSRLAAIVAGVLVLVSGLGLVVPRLALPRFGARLLEPHAGKLVRLRTKSQVMRAGLLGGLTPLLPCGWLYAFVLTSAGTGSAAYGALVMATFWAGTVPALLGMDAVLAKVGVHVRRRVPLISGLTLIALGLFTIGRRLEIDLPTRMGTAQDVHAAPAAPGPHHKCH
jgi:sulfite exporter TauE/SafE